MRIFKLAAAVGLILSTAACAVYTSRDYSYDGYYAYRYRPAPVYYAYVGP